MSIRHLAIAIASAVVAAVGLGACSSDTKNSIVGDSTTTSSAAETTAAPVDSSTVPATVVAETAPPATVAPTAPPVTAPPATAAPGFSLYDEVSGPDVPTTHTDAFASSGVLSDGVYWVEYLGGETFTPSIEVREAFFGAECTTQAAADGDECNNDIYVRGDPSREIDDLPFADDVLLTVADVNTLKSYWITPDELRSVRSSSPSVDDAPDGVFVPFPFLMTVQDGKILKFEQVWVP